MNNNIKNLKINMHLAIRILIALFCFVIGSIVTYVMINIYDPNQNALKALSSVSMDITCIIILLILICSIVFDYHGRNRTTKLFAFLLVATTWAMFLDFLNWAFDGSLEFGHLTFYFTLGSLCMGSILAGIFSLYLYSYIEETHDFNKMRNKGIVCAILNLINFILTFILAISGFAFQFVNGHYETGVLYDVITTIPVLTLLYLTCVVIYHYKTIGLHDVFAVAGYIFFMIAGALVESEYSIGTTYVAVAIADIFIFVMLQNQIIVHEKQNVQKWMKKSNTDVLTGFRNRQAYETDLAALDERNLDDNFVYISVDVNGLKSVNDSFGHYAGDELLVGAAECLKKCFGSYGTLYRIGGDEFIALININEKELDILKKEIEEMTQKWSGELVNNLALSCGYVTRKEAYKMTIRQMAILADRRMYEAKDEYYRRTGLERRKK